MIEDRGAELDDLLPEVTAGAVKNALSGNKRLRLARGRDWEWLAMAVRRALTIAHLYGADNPDSPSWASGKHTRDELLALAAKAGPLAQQLAALSPQTVDVVQEHGDAAYARLAAAANEIAWLMHFAEQAAKSIEVPRQQVLSPARKEMRIDWARYLAPVFEIAFGQRVTAANRTDTTNDLARKELSPFQFFYLLMAEVAFGNAARADTNIVGVTKAARRKHREQPVTFTQGVIPGL